MDKEHTMRKAILLTAFNRPDYLATVLDAWADVRGLEDWDFIISLDDAGSDNPAVTGTHSVASYFKRKVDVRILSQFPKLGVLKHPRVVIGQLFDEGYEFVLRTEDDLVPSDGILEYFDWVARTFSGVSDVKTVHAYSAAEQGRESVVRATPGFNPWVFGTWAKTWQDLADNWDEDYSTHNGVPGQQAGFDWNFDTRVYPKNNWFGIYPEVSRVKNIGEYGVHGTPENLPPSPTFKSKNEIRGGHFDLQL